MYNVTCYDLWFHIKTILYKTMDSPTTYILIRDSHSDDVDQTRLLGQDTVLMHVLTPVFHRNVVPSSRPNIRLWLFDPADQHITFLCNDEKHTPDIASNPRRNRTIIYWITLYQLLNFTDFKGKLHHICEWHVWTDVRQESCTATLVYT